MLQTWPLRRLCERNPSNANTPAALSRPKPPISSTLRPHPNSKENKANHISFSPQTPTLNAYSPSPTTISTTALLSKSPFSTASPLESNNLTSIKVCNPGSCQIIKFYPTPFSIYPPLMKTLKDDFPSQLSKH